MLNEIEHVKKFLSVNTLSYYDKSFEEAFEIIAELGFHYIEPAFIRKYYENIIDDDFFSEGRGKNFGQKIKSLGLQVYTSSVHFNIGDRVEDAEQIKQRIEFSVAMGAKIIISNGAQERYAENFLKCMEAVLPVLEEHDVILALENPGEGLEDNIISTAAKAAELFQKIGNKHVQLNYDPSNAYSYAKGKFYPEKEDFRVALPFCVSLHLKQLHKQTKSGKTEYRFGSLENGATNFKPIIQTYYQQAEFPFMVLEHPFGHMRDQNFTMSQLSQWNTTALSEQQRKMLLQESVSYVHHCIAELAKK